MSAGGVLDLARGAEARLRKSQFLAGDAPGAADVELFKKMFGGQQNVQRWARHMASFTPEQRARWPAESAAPPRVVSSVGGGEADRLQAEIRAAEARLDELVKQSQKEKGGGKRKGALIDLEPEQGCRDFPPEHHRLRKWLFDHFRAVAAQFGFEEYDAPCLEAENIYKVKAGQGKAEAGEDILKDMYNFVTKGGHRVAMRPEMTPSLARLVMQKGASLALPVKWFSIPQCWRQEAIVRGRRREHYQWNMDVIGVKSVTAEAELIAAVVTLMRNLGLSSKDVGIKINSRRLLQTILEKAGVPAELFAPVCVIVDKVDKLERADVEAMLAEKGLDKDTIQSVLSSLELSSLEAMKEKVGADAAVVTELEELWSYLDAYGVLDWVVFDASVVRGLAYYTGVVFEAFDREGKLRAICGGGRYDNLFKTFGSSVVTSACGFGFGDCVIVELLKERGILEWEGDQREKKTAKGADRWLLHDAPLTQGIQDMVIPFKEDLRPAAVGVLDKLRASGRKCDIVLVKKRLADAFEYADIAGAERVVLVAPGEWAEGKVKVKLLREGARGAAVEFTTTVDELIAQGDDAAPAAE